MSTVIAKDNSSVLEEYKETLRNQPRKPQILAEGAIATLKGRGARFAKDQNGKVYILLDGKRITISPNFNNTEYAKLQTELTGKTTADHIGRQICQRVLIAAEATELRFSYLSGFSEDQRRLYLPSVEGLVQISAEGVQEVPNIDNEELVYVEHPRNNPFRFAGEIDTPFGLELFERLLVETQATKVPEQKWLVGIRLGLFPYVRALTNRRQITNLRGSSQDGKTTGAERFLLLHGLGEPLGNVTVPFVQRGADLGLLVLDNREQTNLSKDWIFYLLYVATGAQAGRAKQSGERVSWTDRPVCVLTSVEGVNKNELANRTLPIEYWLPGISKNREPFPNDRVRHEISENRDLILNSLVRVLVEFLGQDSTEFVSQFKPLSANFYEDFAINAGLLLAYAKVSGKGQDWAKATIDGWYTAEDEEGETASELPPLLINLMDGYKNLRNPHSAEAFLEDRSYECREHKGQLYITETGKLLTPLRKLARIAGQDGLPTNEQGLARRLRELTPSDGVILVTEKDDPETFKRKKNSRRIGLLRLSDDD